jgi:predicted nucleic acid-binding protein
MTVRFVDTNVLLYALSTASEEQDKAKRANQILEAGDLAISVQVLQEFYVQATRTGKADALRHEQAVGLVESFLRFHVEVTSVSLLLAAMATKERFQISYWDAAIIEAARAAGCTKLLSEDLEHGRDYDGLRVENPFL